MDVTTGALLLAGAFNLILAAIIFFQAPRTRANLFYALLVVWLLVWIAAILILRRAENSDVRFVALATTYIAGLGIAISFWYFTAFFTRRHVSSVVQVVVVSSALVITWLIWTSPHFIRGVAVLPSGQLLLEIGWHGWIFVLYFGAVMTDAFRVLWHRYQTSGGEERAQLTAIFLGTALTTAIGATLNIILVQIGDASFIGWGPVSTIIMVGFIAFAIVRHHLMAIRLVAAELFTFGLILLLFVNFLIEPGVLPRLFEAVTLQLAIGFGAFLIRAALREAAVRDQLAAANDELRRLDAAKSEFVSLASHQLRAPLTVIQGYASMIEESAGPAASVPVRDRAGRIIEVTGQLGRLVDDLLDLSRAETGRLNYKFAPVDLKALVVDVVRQLENLAEQRHLRLRVDAPNGKVPLVRGDRDKLREVAVNLIDNAIKYSAKGEVLVRLRIADTPRGTVVLSVTDPGIGIAAADLPGLFQKFARTSEAKKMRPDGLGLGLYLVRRIAEDHGGHVWAASVGLGHGATFFVELPVTEADRAGRLGS